MHKRHNRRKEEKHSRLAKAFETLKQHEESLLSEFDRHLHLGDWLAQAQQRDRRQAESASAGSQGQDQGSLAHDQAEYAIQWDAVPAGLSPAAGELPSEGRTLRKCQQLESLISHVLPLLGNDTHVVDFGSGSGHLGLLVAHLAPQCRVSLVERKAFSADKASERISAMGIQNCQSLCMSIEDFTEPFDVAISLHSCGLLTDMILSRCLQVGAAFALTPCCYGQLTHGKETDPLHLNSTLSHSHPEEMLAICSGADFTVRGGDWDFATERNFATAKRCMRLIDCSRLEAMRRAGYNCQLENLYPLNCSPKNDVIIGTCVSDAS